MLPVLPGTQHRRDRRRIQGNFPHIRSDLERVKQHLINNYNYDPGKYKDWDPFKVQNYKILARIDWNINKHHKLMIRYNDVVGSYMNVTNATSAPSGLNRASSARMSANSIAFSITSTEWKTRSVP